MNNAQTKPLVSICVPTYNGAHYLQEALNSIVNQTYINIEVIVSDDASKDATLTIIEEFRNQVNFPVYLYKHKPNGIAANWNYTLEKSNGNYIKFLFQDDVLNSNCIEEMVKVLESNPIVALATCKREIISEVSNRFTEGWIANFNDLQANLNLTKKNVIFIKGKDLLKAPYFKKKPINIIGEPTAVLFRKEVIEKIGYFDESMFQLVDYEFFLRMFKRYDIAFMNEKLVKFRLHNTQASFLNNKNEINDQGIYYKLLYKDYFWWLHWNFKWQLLKKYHSVFKVYRYLRYNLFSKQVKE